MVISVNDPSLRGSVNALSDALNERDSYTQAHCDRVVVLAEELGTACGLSADELARLRICARFHDIGKIGVPDSVLLKSGRLTAGEWVLMKAHSEQGERIFRATAVEELESTASFIRHHHESFDGSGYPDGLNGEAIPAVCRILLVAGAYDALGSARPYHEARNHREIMEVLESEESKKLDPHIFRKFSQLIERSTARVH